MPTEVSVLDKYGETTYYSNYADARMDIIDSEIEHPLVQIWADLDEQIILLDEVDIWIAPGVTISNSSGDTITDNNVAVKCNISGYGNLTQTSTSSYAVCNFTNSNSKVSVKCDIIENESAGQACVSSSAKKFHLECNLVYGKSHGGVYLNNNNSDDLNINAEKIVTGEITELSSGTTAIISKGFGFIHVNEILCRNLGHCLSHRGGNITANIYKMTTKMNRTGFGPISTVHLAANQGTTGQKLILYFDEINCLNGEFELALCAIEHTIGTGIFIGRRVYSEITESNFGATIQISGNSAKGYAKINEIISKNSTALVLSDFNDEIIIDSNYIESNSGAVIYSNGSSSNTGNYILKNAKLKNIRDFTAGRGIFLQNIYPKVTLSNVKIVCHDDIIYLDSGSSIDVKNFGLFGNQDKEDDIILKIGNDLNFLFIENILLT